MPTANYYHLNSLLTPLNTIPSDSYPDVDNIGVIPAIKEIIHSVVAPYYETLSNESKRACKYSLSYYLSTQTAPFVSIFDHQQGFLLDISPHEEEFFRLLWKELFHEEDYFLNDLHGWSEANDIIASTVKYRSAQ